ncbi:hypothetical protein ATL41_2061 [Flavimobilis soli]|uniref:Uncharacterized protein n=1 Tax=Flavimobilis soli TaxID=442709 RepID=A0A2A9EF99_9MICO|nr:hypothetical protein ATL41_2061 [Flavimobilis soli]
MLQVAGAAHGACADSTTPGPGEGPGVGRCVRQLS